MSVDKAGLRRAGNPCVEQNGQKMHYYGGAVREDISSKRGGDPKYPDHAKASKGYDIGSRRAGDNEVFNQKHPGTKRGANNRIDREPFARKQSEWNGPEAQR